MYFSHKQLGEVKPHLEKDELNINNIIGQSIRLFGTFVFPGIMNISNI